MGVWIEICHMDLSIDDCIVTPCVGVWIEIEPPPADRKQDKSLPAWECGLKFANHSMTVDEALVTPCVGVWIEI